MVRFSPLISVSLAVIVITRQRSLRLVCCGCISAMVVRSCVEVDGGDVLMVGDPYFFNKVCLACSMGTPYSRNRLSSLVISSDVGFVVVGGT